MSIVKPAYGTLVNPALAISANIAGAWLFNEGSGTIAHDSSGLGHNGQFEGSPNPTWVAGLYGTTLQFPGGLPASTTGCIKLNAFSIALPCTVVLSVTPKAFDALNYYIALNASELNLFPLGATFKVQGTSGAATTAVVPTAGTNYLIVLTAPSGSACNLNVNGVNSTAPQTLASTPSAPSFLGGGYDYAAADAVIDFVMVWSRILSNAEITTLTTNPFAPYVYGPTNTLLAQLNRRRR